MPEPEVALARAADPHIKEALKTRTQEAMHLGIFGAPSFVVDGTLFWGNDRLEAALDHAADRAATA